MRKWSQTVKAKRVRLNARRRACPQRTNSTEGERRAMSKRSCPTKGTGCRVCNGELELTTRGDGQRRAHKAKTKDHDGATIKAALEGTSDLAHCEDRKGPQKCKLTCHKVPKMQTGPSHGLTNSNWPVTRSQKCKLARRKVPKMQIDPSQGPTNANWPVRRSQKCKLTRHKVHQMQIGPSQGPKNVT